MERKGELVMEEVANQIHQVATGLKFIGIVLFLIFIFKPFK